MTKEDKQEYEKGTFLTDIRFVTDQFDVFEVAEEMDEVDNKQESARDQNKEDSH